MLIQALTSPKEERQDQTRVVDRFLRAHENVELERRIKRIEQRSGVIPQYLPPPMGEQGDFPPADEPNGLPQARSPAPTRA